MLLKLSVDQALIKASTYLKRNELAEAQKIYDSILRSFPKNIRAQQGLAYLNKSKQTYNNQSPPQETIDQLIRLYNQGNLLAVVEQAKTLTKQYPEVFLIWNILGTSAVQLKMFDEAIDAYNKCILINPDYADAYLNMGVAFKEQGKLDEAIDAYNKCISLKPDYAVAYSNIGNILKDQGKLEEAIEAYNKALSLRPNYADAYINMGNALKKQGKVDEAIEAYNKCITLKPDYAIAYNNIGKALQEEAKFEEAIQAYNKALSLNPDYAEVYINIGNILQERSKFDEAISVYNQALLIKPDYAEAYCNMGVAFKEKGKLDEAMIAYNKCISLKPDYAEVYINIGNILQERSKLNDAIDAYNQALLIKPDYAEAYCNMGVALRDQGKIDEAIEAYNKSISIKPNCVVSYSNMANALKDQGKLNETIESYNKVLSINPKNQSTRAQKLREQAKICDWGGIEEDRRLIPELGIIDKSIHPLSMLSLEDAPRLHQLRSKVYTKDKFPQKIIPFPAKLKKNQEKIRLGYFSSDFRKHPVGYLIAKVIEKHSRDKFEIFGYSFNNCREDDLQKRFIKSFDVFREVNSINDKEVSLLSRKDKIDIAIDLNGYTKNSRSGIFAYGAAPIQINYLGFPGSMGSEFMDYIIADQHIIPPKNQKYFTEKKLYLPNTYMPTDNSREFSKRQISRKEMGLPDEAFVFCCFNNNYKITDHEFEIWMRLLSQVKGSVLWLRRSNEIANKNLIKEAKKRNVDASRLVFADKLPMDEHLTRYRLADLFLDTFHFNAHTTTTEALWAGLPVVTKVGQGFAARVACSLLNAIRLPELVTKNKIEYESLILELATNPIKLIKIKEKLAANRLSQPLFNSELYIKHLEDGYLKVFQNYLDGKAPKNTIVL